MSGSGACRDHLDSWLDAVPESPQNAQKVSEAVPEGENQSSAKSEAVVAAPETIRISLPALRGVILAVIDDGDREGLNCDCKEPWPLWHPFSDCANDARLRFCDEIEQRLRGLK